MKMPRTVGVRANAPITACIAMAIALCQFGPFSPQAEGSLNLKLNDAPEIYSSGIAVTYNPSSTPSFTASGIAGQLDSGDAIPDTITDGGFDLSAQITTSGELIDGSLTISGTVMGVTGTLLSGNLARFGYGAAGGPLEFVFDVEGGELSALFGDGAYPGGVILHDKAFSGSFDTAFTHGFATSDTGVIPEPGSVLVWSLLGAVAVVLGCWRRRWRQSSWGRVRGDIRGS